MKTTSNPQAGKMRVIDYIIIQNFKMGSRKNLEEIIELLKQGERLQ